jgi:hypothetical protein
MRRRSGWRTIALLTIVLLIWCGSAQADDVIDSINEALEAYNAGKFGDAVGSLNYAAQLIGQKKGGQLVDLLPEPLDGWTAEEAESQAMGAAMFGGGVSAGRRYVKENASVEVQIVTDSPLMQGMMVMFTNPAFAASDGGKLEKIKGQKAIVKYSEADRQGSINIMVANRFLVIFEGADVTRDELTAYAQVFDYGKLAAMP